MSAEEDNKKKGLQLDAGGWIGVGVLAMIAIFILWAVITMVYDGTRYWQYEDRPSITDDDWLKKNYGGTEHYP